jgi:hypothetical protein
VRSLFSGALSYFHNAYATTVKQFMFPKICGLRRRNMGWHWKFGMPFAAMDTVISAIGSAAV